MAPSLQVGSAGLEHEAEGSGVERLQLPCILFEESAMRGGDIGPAGAVQPVLFLIDPSAQIFPIERSHGTPPVDERVSL